MSRRRASYSEKTASKFIKSIIWGVVSGSIICTVLLFASAFLFVKIGYIPENVMSTFTIIIACIGVFFGGYIAAKISKEKGLITGMAVGLLLFIIVAVVSASVISEPFTVATLTKSLIFIIAGAIGGFTGVYKF